MNNIKKVLVGLDLTQMDELLIKKTIDAVRVLEIEMVYFVHVAKDLTLAEGITKADLDMPAPLDEIIEKNISDAVLRAGFPEGTGFEAEAKEGNPLETLLRWSKVKNVDLLILGRKHEQDGSGSLAKHVAHKSPCSVLFFTENTGTQPFDKIMVPVDFSSYSFLALEHAQKVTRETQGIKCIHIYEVPTGYSKTGKSYEEFAAIMLENAKEDFNNFLKKHHLPPFDCEFILKREDGKARYFMEAAKKEGVDMIILGSRGQTDSATMIIGSVAKKLIHLNDEIPMFVVKKKGETMDFLEALFRL